MEIQTGANPNSSNYEKGRSAKIRYLVIHFTSNDGDTAINNVNYFKNNEALASAHYFVDENTIYKSVPEGDTAWHCGAKTYIHPECRNANSIGIEMCSRKKDGVFYILDQTIQNAIWLTRKLMDKYGISADHVVRHYDVTHKSCPEPMVRNVNLWKDFKNKIVGDDIDMATAAELEKRIAALENKMVYNYVDKNMPEWARDTVTRLVNKGILSGNENGELGLTYEMLKMFVINDRAGLY